MDTSNLYNYEYDFKESHVKHLKRPALVTIKKPLLQKQEMEDVLIRLLNLHVPAVLDEKVAQSGIGRRAFLVDNAHFIQRSAASGENTSFVQRGIFEINHTRNLFLSKTSKDGLADFSNWLSPDRIPLVDRHNEQLNHFSYNESDRVSSDADYRSTHMYRVGDPGYVIAQTTYSDDTKRLTTERNAALYKSYNPYLFFDPQNKTSEPVTVKFDLYLLNQSDHQHLSVDKNTRFSSQKEVLAHSDLFTQGGLPQYKGYHEIYNPNDKDGKNHIMDSSAAKRAFGYVPKDIKYAYHWDFFCPTTTRVAVLSEKVLNGVDNTGRTKAFSDLVVKNIGLYKSVNIPKDTLVSKRLDFIVYYFNSEEHKKLINDRAAQSRYINALKSHLPELNALEESTFSGIMFNAFSSGMVKRPTVSDAMAKAIRQYEAFIENGYAPEENALTMLGLYAKVHKDEIAEAKLAAATRKYIKPKNKCDISIGQFKVEYYAILLNKIKEKYDKLKYFIEDLHLVVLSDEEKYKTLLNTIENIATGKASVTDKVTFVTTAEEFLYNPLAGFYIRSYATGITETKSPYWNSVADSDTFSAKIGGLPLNSAQANTIILDNKNNDVITISIDRVISGMSTATIALKNDKEKYNYKQSSPLNRTSFIIEPMDEVAIYLPTLQIRKQNGLDTNIGELEPVFSGIISKVSARDNAGYHTITINADCQKKLLSINRTNTRPSATRNEADNHMVQAFEMPYEFYRTTENWLTYMFAASLSNLGTQLCSTKTETEFNKNLFETQAAKIIEKKQQTVVSKDVVKRKEIVQEQLPVAQQTSVVNSVKTAEEVLQLKTHYEVVQTFSPKKPLMMPTVKETEHEKTVKVVYELEPGTSNTVTRTVVTGKYTKTEFADHLLTYLWYKTNSVNFPREEQQQIETNLKAVLKDYVYTVVPDVKQLGFTYIRGCEPYLDLLRKGKRAAYYVYKTREDTLWNNVSGVTPCRICVAKIIGTAQPAFTLKTANFDIQFSMWKTNNDIIRQVAERFNFIYYTDRNGIVVFTPYNFDLTTLNTENNTQLLNTDKMLVYRSKRDLQNEDNVQILKDQFTISYTKTDNDNNIVNWLPLNGSWVISDQALDQFTKAIVKDPVLINKFGYRAGKNVSILGIQDEQALQLYGLAWMDRANKKYRSATVSTLFDSRMDINLPYYIPSDEVIYYCEGMRINYTAGSTCTADLNLSYGKKPLIYLEPYVASNIEYTDAITGNKVLLYNGLSSTVKDNEEKEISTYEAISNNTPSLSLKLDELFQNNEIKPSTYSQYKSLLKDNYSIGSINNVVKNTPLVSDALTLFDVGTMVHNMSVDSNMGNNELEDASKRAINASICCFNGLLWDNVAGIAFEELILNYGWLSTGFGTGVTAAMGSDEKLMVSLTKYIQTNQPDIAVTEQTKKAIGTFYIKVPAIQSSKTPPQLDTPRYIYEDLQVDGILNVQDYANK